MSESQFDYGSFTLDELRSLAASPQVGTMQAMPQSFRALADRVGEVADLLSHAQADLPNWWKGPAAEQAAAALGRAAAEAREFHDSAMGAATAVGRCAQVVAEQQNQMMNVPDIQEPGVSAVVQRPTTPFEALEAARQDAAYQAAHEQAVQVVNGIAAQYVETRSQLSNIGVKFGENFTPTGETGQPLKSEEGTPRQNSSQLTTIANKRVSDDGSRLSDAYLSSPREQPRRTSSSELAARTKAPVPGLPLEPGIRSLETAGAKSPNSTESALVPVAPPAPPRETPETVPETGNGRSERNNIASPSTEEIVPPEIFTSEHTPISDYKTGPAENKPYDRTLMDGRFRKPGTAARSKSRNRSAYSPESGEPSNVSYIDHFSSPASNYSSPTLLGATHSQQLGDGSSDSAGIIPPYSGLGSVHRTREERNPRPAYLKERKSAWLPDTVAAPADGVISPDWFEQY